MRVSFKSFNNDNRVLYFKGFVWGSCFKCTLEGRSMAVYFSDLCLHVDMSNLKHYKSTHAITIKRFLIPHDALVTFHSCHFMTQNKTLDFADLGRTHIYHLYTWFARPSIQFFCVCMHICPGVSVPATWLKDFSNGCGWQIIWQLRINVGPQGSVDPTATGCMKFPGCRHRKHNFPINFRSIQKKWFCEVLHNCQRMIEAQSSSHLTVKNPNYFETIEKHMEKLMSELNVKQASCICWCMSKGHVHRRGPLAPHSRLPRGGGKE